MPRPPSTTVIQVRAWQSGRNENRSPCSELHVQRSVRKRFATSSSLSETPSRTARRTCMRSHLRTWSVTSPTPLVTNAHRRRSTANDVSTCCVLHKSTGVRTASGKLHIVTGTRLPTPRKRTSQYARRSVENCACAGAARCAAVRPPVCGKGIAQVREGGTSLVASIPRRGRRGRAVWWIVARCPDLPLQLTHGRVVLISSAA